MTKIVTILLFVLLPFWTKNPYQILSRSEREGSSFSSERSQLGSEDERAAPLREADSAHFCLYFFFF